MKKNRGTPFITLWFEEEMSVVMIMNRNTEQNIGLRPHFSEGNWLAGATANESMWTVAA